MSISWRRELLQTGSGKTYTMGTGLKEGSQTGLIPQVMNRLFNKIETLRHQTEFQLHVSFIEVVKFIWFLVWWFTSFAFLVWLWVVLVSVEVLIAYFGA